MQLREFGREFLIGADQEWRSCQFNESKPLSARTWAVAVPVESDVDIRLMHDKVCGVVGGPHLYCQLRPLSLKVPSLLPKPLGRSEARRYGKAWFSTFIPRGS